MHSFRQRFSAHLQTPISHSRFISHVPLNRPLGFPGGGASSRFDTHAGSMIRRGFAAETPSSKAENTNVGHARFLAEAKKDDDWQRGVQNSGKGGMEGTGSELEGVGPGRGKLSPTSSHLFKLILPLSDKQPPTVFLLHPSQPLSHVSRLISASVPSRPTSIFFRSTAESIAQRDNLRATETIRDVESSERGEVQWADSTDIGDFIKSAARSNEFRVVLEEEDKNQAGANSKTTIEVTVPTFEKRTIYLQNRLNWLGLQLREMESIKNACDAEAHRSAKRLASGGLAILIVYWLGVFRLTFWDYGWDIMEPVSYLSGLSMIVLGYSWFLYQGREVSYSSVMNTSVSRRRAQLYQTRGFDIDRWTDLVTEEKAVKREIAKIAQDYGLEWSGAEKKNEEKKGEKIERDGIDDEGTDDEKESQKEKDAKEVKRKGHAAAEAAERAD